KFHGWAESCANNRGGENSVGRGGCISWPLSGPSEPPCRTAAIDRSCTTCAALGRSGSSVTADKPVRVKAAGWLGLRVVAKRRRVGSIFNGENALHAPPPAAPGGGYCM